MSGKRLTSSRPSVPFPEPPTSPELAVELPSGCRFGVCLTHDVDHLSLREHFVDGFLLRYAVNIGRQNLLGRFRPGRALGGWGGIAAAALGRDPWDALEALAEAESRAGVRASWFFAVRPGLGIAYDRRQLSGALASVARRGLEIGLHGQSPDSGERLADEARLLGELAGQQVLGLRMHYLRLTSAVLDGMQASGLRYDSTVMDRSDLDPETVPLPGPRRMRDGLIEIPLHVMDSTLFSVTGLGLDQQGARAYVRRLCERAAEDGRVVVINLHPNNYSSQEPEQRAWYDALLAELTRRSDAFLTDMRGLVERIEMP